MDYIEEHGKCSDIIVVFTNRDKIKSFEVTHTGKVVQGQTIGEIVLQ
jgi:hypothetical protein